MPDDVPYSFIEGMVQAAPPWLRRRVGGAIMRALGTPAEAMATATADGVAVRFPGAVAGATDALPYIGSDRRILRGPAEDDATYAVRLRTWWEAHRRRGSTYALLEQLYLYLVNTEPRQWDFVARNGLRHVLDGVTGEITRDLLPTTLSTRWARAVLFALFDSYPSISTQQREAYIAMPREWAAAHMEPIPTIAVWGGGVWGYPAGELWGEPVGELWGEGAFVVNDLYASVPEHAITIGGVPVTMLSDYVTVTLP